MWVRKRLDIGWSDLVFGLTRATLPPDEAAIRGRLEQRFSPAGDALACLSVRSGFDLLLAALELPVGSEVLLSAMTIPDMARIVEEHGLVPVPVDLDSATMAPTVESLRRSMTHAARVLVVAHLFGSRAPLEPLLETARSGGLTVVEDCAQVFDGRYFGHPDADVSMFSFGPIKTATALGGGVLRVRDTELLRRMRTRQAVWPIQSHREYRGRIAKYAALKLASCRPVLRIWMRAYELAGRDFDRMANAATRGFAGPGFFARIRRRPSPLLLAMMDRRWRTFDARRVAARAVAGRQLAGLLAGSVFCPAVESARHSYWVFPILVANPEEVIASLRRAGFDATQGASMYVVPPPATGSHFRAVVAESLLPGIVYLPLYPELPPAALRKMAEVVRKTSQVVWPARLLACLRLHQRHNLAGKESA